MQVLADLGHDAQSVREGWGNMFGQDVGLCRGSAHNNLRDDVVRIRRLRKLVLRSGISGVSGACTAIDADAASFQQILQQCRGIFGRAGQWPRPMNAAARPQAWNHSE